LYVVAWGALGAGVAWLVGPGVLRGRAAPPPLLPTALCPLPWWSRCGKSTVELGRELLGVALGVEAALSGPRDFRDEERGVRAEVVRKGLPGARLSADAGAAFEREEVPVLVRAVRELEELRVDEADEATASRGVKGVFAGAGRVLASVGFSGRGLLRSVRSMGILQNRVDTVRDGGGWCRGSSWPAGARQWAGGEPKGGVDDGC
jgi:hypothetical protein